MTEELDSLIEVNDENYDEIMNKHEYVVLDFWASWCGPCKMMDPVIEDLAEKYQDEVIFGKVNAENNSKTVSRFGVQAIPTFIFFINGEVVDQARGAIPKKDMDEKIKKNFKL